MFWTFLKWGGTAALILIVVLAALFGGDGKTAAPGDTPGGQAEQPQPQPAKKFNL